MDSIEKNDSQESVSDDVFLKNVSDEEAINEVIEETIKRVDEEIVREVNEEAHDDFKAKIEILAQQWKEDLKPLVLTDCYATDRPGMLLEIVPKMAFDATEDDEAFEEIEAQKPIFRQTVDQGNQASIEYDSNAAQTLKNRLVNAWSQCEPRLFSEEEIEREVKSPAFTAFIENVQKRVLDSLIQNNIADNFLRDLDTLDDGKKFCGENSELNLQLIGQLLPKEIHQDDRAVSSIQFHPQHKNLLIISTINSMTFEERTDALLNPHTDMRYFHLWNIKNQFAPKLSLEYVDDISCFKFNNTIPHLIAGGSLTGQLVLFDIKLEQIMKNELPENEPDTSQFPVIQCVAVSNMDHAHQNGVVSLQWISPQYEILSNGELKETSSSQACQIVTCGHDGYIHFWDLKFSLWLKPGSNAPKKFDHLDGLWDPLHTAEVLSPDGRKQMPVTCFTLRQNIGMNGERKIFDAKSDKSGQDEYSNSQYYAGCEDGSLVCGNFTLAKDDGGKLAVPKPDYYSSPHNGAITSISCSPFFDDIFLSTGFKTAAIWKHNNKNSPIYFIETLSVITCGQWSPWKPSVLFLGLNNGSVAIYDLLNDMYWPTISHFVSTFGIKSMCIHSTEDEHVLTVGDAAGVVYILQLPPILHDSTINEKEKMKQFFDKEENRLDHESEEPKPESILSRQVKTPKTVENVGQAEAPMGDKTLAESYAEFLELQNEQLKMLGLE